VGVHGADFAHLVSAWSAWNRTGGHDVCDADPRQPTTSLLRSGGSTLQWTRFRGAGRCEIAGEGYEGEVTLGGRRATTCRAGSAESE